MLRRSDTKESNAEKEIVFPNLTINLSNYELKINGNIILMAGIIPFALIFKFKYISHILLLITAITKEDTK